MIGFQPKGQQASEPGNLIFQCESESEGQGKTSLEGSQVRTPHPRGWVDILDLFRLSADWVRATRLGRCCMPACSGAQSMSDSFRPRGL